MKDENLIGNARKATDFLGNTYEYECMGCSIEKGEIIPSGGIIYKDEYFILAQDPEIPIDGFIIINSRRHINSFVEMTENERNSFIELLYKSEKAIKELNIAEKVTIVQEERSKHLHVWIFPHHDWMNEKFGKGISYLRDICAYAQEYATQDDKDKILNDVNRIREYIDEIK